MKTSSFLSVVAMGLLFFLPLGCGSSKSSTSQSSGSGSSGGTGTSTAPLAVTSVSPNKIVAGEQTTLTITGTGFSTSSVVQVNGSSLPTVFVSTTQLTAVVTAGQLSATQSLSVTVVDKGTTAGGASTAIEVDNPKPAIASLNPSSAAIGSAATNVTVSGSNFLSSTVMQVNGANRTTTYSNAGQVSVALTAGDLSSAATLSLAAVNPSPGGGASDGVPFAVTNPVPVLSSISPSIAYRTFATTTITLVGTGFLPTSTVLFNGVPVATTFINATKLSVTLAKADLPQTAATATLQVSTPAPGGGTSATLPLKLSSLIPPVITAVNAGVRTTGTTCPQIMLSITGTNLSVPSPLIKINGTTIPPQYYTATSGTMSIGLPLDFLAGANPQITIESQGIPDLVSAPFTITSSAAAVCIQPYLAVVYPGTSFALDTTASSINPTAAPSISGLTVPAGFTAVSSAPYNPPTRIVLSVDANTPPGNYSITPQMQNAAAITVPVPVTVSATKPNLIISSLTSTELAVPIGGSTSFSTSIVATSPNSGINDFVVDVGVEGLPPGVSATVQPASVIPGDAVTVTLTADKTAAPVQNSPFNLVAQVPGLALVTKAPLSLSVYKGVGSIPNNRTSFTALGATPSAAVYDSVHNLIFASNTVWNRIDVISNQSHKVIQSIPVASPQGIDLSQDSGTLWIATSSRQVYALDTTAFTMRRYTLQGAPVSQWSSSQIFAMSNGDLFLITDRSSGSNSAVIFTPSTGAINYISTFADSVLRSGDGTKVFGLVTAITSGCAMKVYSAAQGMQTYTLDSGFTGSSFCGTLHTSNRDGSMVIGNFNGLSVRGIQVIDSTARVVASFTPALTPGILSTSETVYFAPAAFHFGSNDTVLYQTGVLSSYRNLLATYDVSTWKLLGLAPAIYSSVPPMSSGYGGPSKLVDVDPSGMLIGIQSFGIAFEDAGYYQNIGSTTQRLSSPAPASFAPQSGPLSGGTKFSINGYTNLQPDVWFGDIRGMASVAANSMSVTSPAATDPGPVDLKTIYPNGMMGYTAGGFSYGPAVQNMVYSGASPAGGVQATLTGFGLPADSSGGSVTVGGSAATITTTVGQYPPWTGESIPSTYLKFTVPAGVPGYADVTVQTPNGSSTMPKGMFYASSVNNYAFDGPATSVIYDRFHNRAYIVTNSKVLVFDQSAGSFLSPIVPPTANGVLDLYDAAISVDGNSLIVTNRGDASVAVVDIATGSRYVISTPYLAQPGTANCGIGPGPVAALAGNKASYSLSSPTTTATAHLMGASWTCRAIRLLRSRSALTLIVRRCRAISMGHWS